MFETSFSPVTPESAETLLSAYPAFGSGDCNLTAVSLISRAAARKASFAVIEGIPVVRWHPTGEEAAYAVPACAEKMKPVLEHLSEEARLRCEALYITGVVDDLVANLTAYLPAVSFRLESSNDYWDYIYDGEAFVTLAGRKLNGKRNFARRFHAAHPQATLEPLTPAHVPAVRDFLTGWYAEHDSNTGLTEECEAISIVLANLTALNVTGRVLTDAGRVLGFTYGAECAPGLFAVHIEKTARDVAGAYPVLAQEFAKSLPEHITELNREEDLGIPGLRKAKTDWVVKRFIRKCRICVDL